MTIKSKIKLLVFVIIFLILILPIINYLKHEGEEDLKIRRSSLFNIDFIISPAQRMVFGMGISLNPQQAYIGKEGWVFLGDSYQSGISSRRSGLTTEDQQVAEKIKSGLLKWNEFFKANGVDDFLIMLGPDKATIYPEYLPNWAKPSDLVRTDAVLGDIGSSLFFDTRKVLLEAKSFYDNRVYYKTDTHWNNLGAWIAFNGFIKELSSKSVNDGVWLKDKDVSFYQYKSRQGGDLSSFLRLRDYLSDEEPVYKINESDYFSVNSVEKRTGDLKSSEIIKNNKALNSKKVLWLTDSFGGAVSPFMSATFSDIYKVHYGHVNSEILINIIKDFQPDYVFFTVVERALLSLNIGLTNLPPSYIVFNELPDDFNFISSNQSSMNDLDLLKNNYLVTNNRDPFIVYTLEEAIKPEVNNKISFNINCHDLHDTVSVQLFWSSPGSQFKEAQSVRVAVKQGQININLSGNDNWMQSGLIDRFRIDIDSPEKCANFNLTPPYFY